MIDTSVKYFHSELQGAPILNGTAGSFISLLDACLVNGFGLKTVDTLVVSGGIATLTIGTGHSFEQDTVATISGATPAGLNGEKKIISASGNSATFDATGIANQTATGTITARLASAGWAKPFSGINLAAYVSDDPQANGRYLRVDDTGTTNARIVGYEAMTAISSGTGMFPSDSQQAGGLYLTKSNSAGTRARPWLVFADARCVYFCIGQWDDAYPNFRLVHGFGDIIQNALGADPYSTFINGARNGEEYASSPDSGFGRDENSPSNNIYIARPVTGIGAPLACFRHADGLGFGQQYNSGAGTLPYPNLSDNGLYLSNVLCNENTPYNYRGIFPGIFYTPQYIAAGVFQNKNKVQNLTGLSGRSIVSVVTNASSPGVVFFDVTGPWR